MTELRGNGGLKLHALMGHGMEETQQEGMETQTVDGVVAVTIFCIATNRVMHVGSMYADLVLPSCFKLELNQRMVGGAGKHMKVGNSIFTTVVYR